MTWRTVSQHSIFSFDVEARPGPWAGSDFTFRHMLSIAGRELGGKMKYLAPGFSADELEEFVYPLRMGAIALTHNGPKYDLPMVSGTLMRYGLKPLPRLMVTDTYAHFPKRGQAFSASLGNLAQRFEVGKRKGSMSEAEWDAAYNGDPEALVKLRRYNCNDVDTTIALRKRLLELNLLGPPRWWTP